VVDPLLMILECLSVTGAELRSPSLHNGIEN